jgi:hypothetical protein
MQFIITKLMVHHSEKDMTYTSRISVTKTVIVMPFSPLHTTAEGNTSIIRRVILPSAEPQPDITSALLSTKCSNWSNDCSFVIII